MCAVALGRGGEFPKCHSSSQSHLQFSLFVQWLGHVGPFFQRKGQENYLILKQPFSPLFLQSPTNRGLSLASGWWECPKFVLHLVSVGPDHEWGGLGPPACLPCLQPLLPSSPAQVLQSGRGFPRPLLSSCDSVPVSLQQTLCLLYHLS